MAQLQQMMAQMGGGGGGAPGGPSGGMPPQLAQMMSQMGGGGAGGGMGGGFPGGPADLPANPTLTAEEKRWTTLYPIYFDAKRPFRKGARRVKLDEACLWPLSEDIADAAQRLRLLHAHEVSSFVSPECDVCLHAESLAPTTAQKDTPERLGEPRSGQGAPV